MSYDIERDYYGDSMELEHERDMMERRGAMMEDRLGAQIDESEMRARMAEEQMLVWKDRAEKMGFVIKELIRLTSKFAYDDMVQINYEDDCREYYKLISEWRQ